jgi:hypothetical protein
MRNGSLNSQSEKEGALGGGGGGGGEEGMM